MMECKRDALYWVVGAGGYIARSHFAAIKATGGRIAGICDLRDSLGQIDAFEKDVPVFSDFNELLLDAGFETGGDRYVVICTPNDLHRAQAIDAMEAGLNVVLEKPAALTAPGAEDILAVQRATDRECWPVLQMRLHPDLMDLKRKIVDEKLDKLHVGIDYVTYRGPWYHASWKGGHRRSGGIGLNLGVHLFDLAQWLFGYDPEMVVGGARITDDSFSGVLCLPRATVTFNIATGNEGFSRTMDIAGFGTYDFTSAVDLHTAFYEHMLLGKVASLEEAIPAIRIVNSLDKRA